MANIPYEILKASRPVHWTKNLALFAALIFSGKLFIAQELLAVVLAFVGFSLITSSTYLINDLIDVKGDKLHPFKKNRSIASGKLPVNIAIVTAIFYAIVSLYIAVNINSLFFLAILSYLLIQIFYSLALKNLAIVDILIIASGFIIRVYAGAFVINAHLSVWFLLCVISIALFLASGKRRAELGLASRLKINTRTSLAKYPRTLLDSYVTMFGNSAWLSWALFTFYESPPVSMPVWLFLAEISRTTTISKLLMATIPIVIFGIMRYESLIFEDRSETPEKVLLTDVPLIMSIFIWTLVVIWTIYFNSLMI